MSNNNKVVIFDFDGVIADSLNTVLSISQIEDPNLTKTEYIQRFEGNINDHATTKQQQGNFDFFSYYEPKVVQQPIVNGIAGVITNIARRHTLVIVSSTTTEPIKKFLQHHNLLQHFAGILGNDIAASKVTKFKLVFDQHGISAKEAVMITDTLGDLREASAVDLKTIAVTWGYHDEETLRKGNPAALVDNPAELAPQIESILKS